MTPSIYTMDHPDFIVCSFMENTIGLKRVKEVPLVCGDKLTHEETQIYMPISLFKSRNHKNIFFFFAAYCMVGVLKFRTLVAP